MKSSRLPQPKYSASNIIVAVAEPHEKPQGPIKLNILKTRKSKNPVQTAVNFAAQLDAAAKTAHILDLSMIYPKVENESYSIDFHIADQPAPVTEIVLPKPITWDGPFDIAEDSPVSVKAGGVRVPLRWEKGSNRLYLTGRPILHMDNVIITWK